MRDAVFAKVLEFGRCDIGCVCIRKPVTNVLPSPPASGMRVQEMPPKSSLSERLLFSITVDVDGAGLIGGRLPNEKKEERRRKRWRKTFYIRKVFVCCAFYQLFRLVHVAAKWVSFRDQPFRGSGVYEAQRSNFIFHGDELKRSLFAACSLAI